MLSARLFED